MKHWYYAKGGQKFGPFQKSQIDEFYNQGEIAPADLVWEEGAPEWVAAGKMLSGSGATPASSAAAADLAMPAEFHPVDALKRGWHVTWKHPGHFIGGSFISMMLMNAPSMVANIIVVPCMILMGILVETLKDQPLAQGIVSGGLILLCVLAVLIISGAFMYPILSGLYWMMLRVIRGAAPELADLFYGFKKPRVWELAKAGLAVMLTVTLGFVLLILPGIYLTLAYMFTPLLIIDKKLPWREAMRVSHQTVRRHFWAMLGLMALNMVLGFAGALCCYVGVFIAMPVSFAASMYAYEIWFRDQPEKKI